MKSFPVAGGRSVSLALYSDVSNSRYEHASAAPVPLVLFRRHLSRCNHQPCRVLTFMGEMRMCELAEYIWCWTSQGAPRLDAVREAGAGGRVPQRITGALPFTYQFPSWSLWVMMIQARSLFHSAQWQVPDVFPVLAAGHKALLSKARESLTTRTLHSELVYNYSGSKHVIDLAAVFLAIALWGWSNTVRWWFIGDYWFQISESLKRCGISDDTAYILAARFDASDEEVWFRMKVQLKSLN